MIGAVAIISPSPNTKEKFDHHIWRSRRVKLAVVRSILNSPMAGISAISNSVTSWTALLFQWNCGDAIFTP